MAKAADGMEPYETSWCSCFQEYYNEKNVKKSGMIIVPASNNCPRHSGKGQVVTAEDFTESKPVQPEVKPAKAESKPKRPARAEARPEVEHKGRRGRKPAVAPVFDGPPSPANFFHNTHAKECPACLAGME